MASLINNSMSDITVANGYIESKNYPFVVEDSKSSNCIRISPLPNQIRNGFSTSSFMSNGSTHYSYSYNGTNVSDVDIKSGGAIVVDGYDVTDVVNKELELLKQNKSLLPDKIIPKKEEGLRLVFCFDSHHDDTD